MPTFYFFLFFISAFSSYAESEFLTLCKNNQTPEIVKTLWAIHDALFPHVVKSSEKIPCEAIDDTMVQITELDLSNKDISSIYPLFYFNHLKRLDISHNNISNLWPLVSMNSVTHFNASDNKITDITVLGLLKNLRFINLNNNKIKNILPIKDLYFLSRVSIENNPVLTDKSEEESYIVKNSLESMIYARLFLPNNTGYRAINTSNRGEVVYVLNNYAKNGSLDFFRYARENEENTKLLNDNVIWDNLNLSTKKIIFGALYSNEMTYHLRDKIIEELGEVSPKDLENIYNFSENAHNNVRLAIEYFLMADAKRAPFSREDKKTFFDIFSTYAKKVKFLSYKLKGPAVFKILFSPDLIANALTHWEEENKTNFSFCMQTGK